MNAKTSLIAFLSAAAMALALCTGCTVDFDYTDGGPYSCAEDNECINNFVCDNQPASEREDGRPPTNTCMRESEIPDDQGPDENNDQPTSCNPDELGDDYPLDEPLDVQEVCDGLDNNCDGDVDVIYCGEGTLGCPSSGTDAAGNEVDYQCNEDLDPPQCEAIPFKLTGACSTVVLDCVDGEIEETPEDCVL